MRSQKRPTRLGRANGVPVVRRLRKKSLGLFRPGNSSAADLNGRLLRSPRRRGTARGVGRGREGRARGRGNGLPCRRLKTCAMRRRQCVAPAGCQPALRGPGAGKARRRVVRTSGSCRSRASSAGCSRRRCRPAAGLWGRRRSPSGSRAASESCPSAPSWGRA